MLESLMPILMSASHGASGAQIIKGSPEQCGPHTHLVFCGATWDILKVKRQLLRDMGLSQSWPIEGLRI